MMTNIENFKEAMRRKGIEPPSTIVADRKFHRFHVNGDKIGSKNGWYVLFDYGSVAAGTFGCFKRDVKEKWSSKAKKEMTTEEKSFYEETMEEHDQEQERLRTRCRKKAIAIWENATKEGAEGHPYTIRKGIKPLFARITEADDLVIPVRDIENKIHGLQFIDSEGGKKFLPGTAKRGNFLLIGKNPDDASALIICEGWATGCSLRQATKLPVVVTFDAGNLLPVAESWRAKLPGVKIIIAGDDDHASKSKNTGKAKAIEAARMVSGIAVFPDFADKNGRTDFNDMHQEQGLVSVNDLIMEACSKEPSDVAAWQEPILFGHINTPAIPSTLLPEPLAGFCKAVMEHTQTPQGLSVMMVLAVVSACLQKRFEVAPYGDSYTEPVNIMPVTAVESGTRKTAVVNAATKPLGEWEKTQAEALQEKAAKVQHKRDMLKRSIDAIKSKASKADASNEELKEALDEIKRLEELMPEEIVIPQLWVDDVTVERLGMLLAEHHERMAVISDEGGFFEVISGLYSGGITNINVILQSHAGSFVRVQRMGRTVTLTRPALTLGLAVQPDIISNLATGSKARFRGNGMLARLLFCIPESTVGSRDVSKRESIPDAVTTKYHEAIHRLLAIKPLKDEFGGERPRILQLSPDALLVWQRFSQYIEDRQGRFGEYALIKDWTCKLPGAVLRIAGLCHVVEKGKKNNLINRSTVKRAISLAKLLIVHAKVAFGMMGSDQGISDAKVVLQWVLGNNEESFRRSDLHKALHGRFPRVERLKSALNLLAERHIISEPQERYTGRRPEIVYTVNPNLSNVKPKDS